MKDTCYFDGLCGMCRRSVRILRALDWLHRLAFADMLSVPPGQLPVDLSIAMTGMPMRTRTGRVLVGFPAVRRALVQTPLAALPALFLYIPGFSHLGGLAYQKIAVNRRRQACSVPLPRPPSNPPADTPD